MAAPVKALIQPTTYSIIDLTKLLNKSNNVNAGSMQAGQLYDDTVRLNPMNTRFALVLPVMTTTISLNLLNNTSRLSTVASSPMYMATNTFPAAYQVTSIRPSFGQLWPRSGAIPF